MSGMAGDGSLPPPATAAAPPERRVGAGSSVRALCRRQAIASIHLRCGPAPGRAAAAGPPAGRPMLVRAPAAAPDMGSSFPGLDGRCQGIQGGQRQGRIDRSEDVPGSLEVGGTGRVPLLEMSPNLEMAQALL